MKTVRGKTDILVTFHLNTMPPTGYSIICTDLMVLVRCGRRRCRTRKARRGGRRAPPASITLKIYNMLNSTGDNDGGQLIALLKVFVRRTKWQKLIIPTSVIQEVVDSTSRVLPMRIACENCSKSIRPVAVRKVRRKKARKSRRNVDAVQKSMRQRRKSAARRERRLRKQRAKVGGKVRKKKQPFLIITTRRVEPMAAAEGGPVYSRTMPMGELRIRQRRHSGSRRDVVTSSSARTCRKKALYVSFRQLGLDNLIAWPHGYITSYCESIVDSADPEVPVERLLHRRHRSNLLTHIKNGRSIGGASPASCCHPIQTAPLSIVYYKDKNNIVEASIPGLTVTECGCIV